MTVPAENRHAGRRNERCDLDREGVLALVRALPDPELPFLSLGDLGIVRWVKLVNNETRVGISPTYGGCPATEFIEKSIADLLHQHGVQNVETERVLSPAWSSDWISQEGRKKLAKNGIMPPRLKNAGSEFALCCPRCKSRNSEKLSDFGSTPCKAIYRCSDCLEPFEYFKCL